jgi:hypothetical protein
MWPPVAGQSAPPRPAACPACGAGPPFTVIMPPVVAAGTSSASAVLYAPRVLDGVRLTVLGVLLGIGLTVGLGLGFGIGGGAGAIAGPFSGITLPVALALAFRWPSSREWLARVADWAIRRDG